MTITRTITRTRAADWRRKAVPAAAVALLLAACGTGGGSDSSGGGGGGGGGGSATNASCSSLTKVKLQLQWVAQSQFAGYYATRGSGPRSAST